MFLGRWSMGQPTHPRPKGTGDKSMSVKRIGWKGSNRPAPRDPRVMAKARLPEIQSRSEYDEVPLASCLTPMSPFARWVHEPPRPLTRGKRKSEGRDNGHRPRRRDEWMAYHALAHTSERNSGLPKGREPHGNGAPIVVRVRESRLHGEAGQAVRLTAAWRYAKCSPPTRCWQSSAIVKINVATTGEPCAVKVASTVRRGADGKGLDAG
jgi:hypothetical protein